MSVRHRRYVQCDGAPTLGSRKSATPLSEVVTLKIHQNNKAKELDFQVVETISKPLLSAETCEKLGLFKLTISDTVQVNSVGPVSVKMSAPLIRGKVLTEYKDVFDCLGHIGDSSSFTIDPNYPLVQHVLRYILVTLQKKKRPSPLHGLAAWWYLKIQKR